MKIKLLIDRLNSKVGDVIDLPNEKALAFIQSGRGIAYVENKAERAVKSTPSKEIR